MNLDIIFIEFPNYICGIARILSKLGFRIYYMKIKPNSDDDPDRFADFLKSINIMPLPMEILPELIKDDESDPIYAKRLLYYLRTLTPSKLSKKNARLYNNVTNISEKTIPILQTHYQKYISHINVSVNYFARNRFSHTVILCGLSFSDLYLPFLEKNVKLIIIPIEDIITPTINVIKSVVKKLTNIHIFNQKHDHTESNKQYENVLPDSPKVAYAIHGSTYGSLFEKNIYYSQEITSDFYQKNILHIDYSNYSYDPSVPVVFFGNHRQHHKLIILSAIKYIAHTMCLLTNMHQIEAYFLMMKTYILFNSYRHQLQKYPSLRLLLVDYDVLCPKELILACESLNIRTLATNERYLAIMNNNYGSILVDDYLSPSSLVSDVMKKSVKHSVKNYIEVGQYRSDFLYQYKSEIPSALKKPIQDGKKIIVALGFHTDLTWYESMSDPLINWDNHLQFLSDMIQLSKDLSNVYIILRYKAIDWIELPVFTEKIAEINRSDNICISDCYSEFNYSYKLCAHADLVIAKSTSLADECLSCGIPVLFHDYLCNCKHELEHFFDYGNKGIICEDYEELLSKSKIVLYDAEKTAETYSYIRSYAYDNLGDGKTVDRIRKYTYSLLEN